MPRIADKTTGDPPMIGRCLDLPAWRAYLASYDFGSIPPSFVVLHHTWRPTRAQWRGIQSMKGMQRYYAGLGWHAAPHLYSAPDGIWLFTPMYDPGIHANWGNAGYKHKQLQWYSLGLEMVGNYDTERPSGMVWEQSVEILGGLSIRLGMKPRSLLYFHRDFNTQKSCPGWAVTKDWVISEVERWLDERKD